MNVKYCMAMMMLALLVSGCTGGEDGQDSSDRFADQQVTNIAHWLSQSDRRGAESEVFFSNKNDQ
jgi:hypothetical protein